MRLPFTAVAITVMSACLLLPALGSAEFYKYKDAKGVVRFTDDIMEVPEGQRDQAQKYRSSKSTPAAAKVAPAGEGGKAGAGQPGPPAFPGQDDASKAEKERLEGIKAELTQEYSDLLKLREELEKAREMAVDSAAKRDVENQIIKLNARIKAFDEKSKAFEKDLNAYNNRLKNASEKATQ